MPLLYSVRNIRAHLLLVYGDQDRWMNAGCRLTRRFSTNPGSSTGSGRVPAAGTFSTTASPARYNAKAAELALLEKRLKS